jgi:murein L,D-transpeptidase YafK
VTLRIIHCAAPLVTAAIIAITAAGLGGCSSALYQQEKTVRTGSVRAATLRSMEKLNMDRAAPVLVRIYKEDNTLEVWKQDRTGRFALLNSYPICKYSGNLGPKIATGDYQAP